MSSTNMIDLCSDNEDEQDNKINLIKSNISIPCLEQFDPPQSEPLHLSANKPAQMYRQFWKAGDYSPSSNLHVNSGGQNRIRVHPKFLHSNATSHTWVFGAIAELLDNAIDEVKNGATYVKIDKMQNPKDGKYALLIQDNGGGMGPESLRQCMSFGFSEKCDGSSIGQYGNGFKTSTMRIGADALVFSRCLKESGFVQSVGLLSFTFLTNMGFDDILVPIVDYEYDATFGTFRRLFRNGERQFLSNLSVIRDWSPFSDEMQLLNQLNEIGTHGTRIIVYNLWLNDKGDLELDFTSDQKDIMISGAPKPEALTTQIKQLNEMHVANRFKFSLCAYASILYLHVPDKFRIILCGNVVEPHYIVSDLVFRECIKYKPHKFETEVITTIGFLNGAPNININGFNIYHKNRLILPFSPIGFARKCRGVAGVLEANFIKPTHNKQDFERSDLFSKLELRLHSMAYEYWKFHCLLIGYKPPTPKTHVISNKIKTPPLSPNLASTHDSPQTLRGPGACEPQQTLCGRGACEPQQTLRGPGACEPQQTLRGPGACEPTAVIRPASTGSNDSCHSLCFEPVIIGKRKSEGEMKASGAAKRQAGLIDSGNEEQKMLEGYRILVSANKKLLSQCLEYETAEKELSLKVQRLTSELEAAQQIYKGLLTELDTLNHLQIQTF
ncbi:hypothetical protein LUZ60_012881 [Juncus effusus]|nr:hypothetical protein LUZ60_012881 [Juncus effusus]